MNGIEWREPAWLLLLSLPVLIWLFLKWRQNRVQQSYADAHLWPWVNGQAFEVSEYEGALSAWRKWFVKFTPLKALGLAWLAVVIALAEPRELVWEAQTSTTQAADIMVVLDLSPSMAAEDVYPSRFAQAKQFLESMAVSSKPSDRLGLTVFSGQAHLIAPLSHDRALFLHYLQLLAPDMLPTRGSGVELGIMYGWQYLQETAQQSPAMLVLSDGRAMNSAMPPLPKNDEQMLTLYDAMFKESGSAMSNVPLVILGVGGSQPSVLPDPNVLREQETSLSSEKLWMRNQQLVTSALESELLQSLSQQLKGDYFPLDTSQLFLDKVLSKLEPDAVEKKSMQQEWVSYSDVFLKVGLLSLIWAFYSSSILGWVKHARSLGKRRGQLR